MRNQGFTLLEVILGSTILAIIGTLTWGGMNATFKTQRSIERSTELQEVGTALLNKIREDLSQVFFVDAVRPITYLRGTDDSNRDRISFSALAHYPLTSEAKECDQTEITYETESNPEQPGLLILKRRESKLLDDRPDEGGEFIQVADNVVLFDLQYSDGQRAFDDWDTKSPENLNRLPKMIQVSFTLRSQTGVEESFDSILRLPMSESLGASGSPTGGLTPPGTGGSSGSPSQTPSPAPTPTGWGL